MYFFFFLYFLVGNRVNVQYVHISYSKVYSTVYLSAHWVPKPIANKTYKNSLISHISTDVLIWEMGIINKSAFIY